MNSGGYSDDYTDEFSEFAEIENDVVPCPFCGEEVYEDSPQCHRCGQYLLDDGPRIWPRKPRWLIHLGLLLVLLAAIAFIAPYLFTLVLLLFSAGQ